MEEITEPGRDYNFTIWSMAERWTVCESECVRVLPTQKHECEQKEWAEEKKKHETTVKYVLFIEPTEN